MKKILIPTITLLTLLLLSACAAACDQKYGGIVQPYPVGAFIEVLDYNLPAIEAKICNMRTKCCVSAESHSNNYVQFELANMLTSSKYIQPWMFGDEIELTFCEGSVDCIKSFRIGDEDKESMAVFHFRLEPSDSIIDSCDANKPAKKCEIIKGDDLIVDSLDEKVTVKEVSKFNWYSWIPGFLGLIAFFLGLIFGRERAKKMWGTFLKKHRLGQYKKRK